MSVSAALAAKIAAPVILLGVGTVGFVLPVSHAASALSATVWIDAPIGGSQLPVGRQTVLTHASDAQTVESIRLFVDGHQVATTSALTRTGTLAYGSLGWDAAAGPHRLVAQDDHGHKSTPVSVSVGVAAISRPSPGVTARPTASAGPTTAAGSTTTSLAPLPTSTDSPTRPAQTSSPPRSSPPRGPSAPNSSTLVAPPSSTAPPVLAILAVSVSPATIDYVCPGPDHATVSATVTGASGVTAYYGGRTYPMTHAGSRWTVNILSSDFPQNQGPSAVSVEAVHPGEKAVDLDTTTTLSVETCKP